MLGARIVAGEHGDDVLQALLDLSDEIVGLELRVLVPADLASDVNDASARRDAVGITGRLRPSLRLQRFQYDALRIPAVLTTAAT
jgi:hypothetical protein